MRAIYSILMLMASVAAAQQPFDGKTWWHHVEVLAAENMEGRGVGTPGEQRAEAYVVDELRKTGLAPAGVESYYQPVRFETRQIVENESSAALVRDGKAQPLVLGEDAFIGTFPDLVPALLNVVPKVEAPLVFIGHGIRIPETSHDDFTGMDLKGKIVVTLDAGPPEKGLTGPALAYYYDAERRWKLFRDAGVLGWITIPLPGAWSAIKSWHDLPTQHLAYDEFDLNKGRYLIMLFNPDRAEKLFEGSGHTAAELFAFAKEQKPLPRFSLPVTLRATVRTVKKPIVSANVIAKLEGSDPQLKNEYVVLSAHIDHLGIRPSPSGDRIYPGAMDNASGVAALLDIAAELKKEGVRPKRSLLFVFFTGEEQRVLGSQYFTAHPTVDLRSIVANLNIDTIHAIVSLQAIFFLGQDESDLGDAARRAAALYKVPTDDESKLHPSGFTCCSDQRSFVLHGIPALMPRVGFPGELAATLQRFRREVHHTPADNLQQPINLDTAAKVEAIMQQLLLDVANDPRRPQWKPNSFYKRYAAM